METSTKYEYELNQIKGLCIGDRLTYYEKGELVGQFMARYGVNRSQLAELLGEDRKTIGRWFEVHTEINKMPEKTAKEMKEMGGRQALLMMDIAEPNAAKKRLWFLKHKAGLDSQNQEYIIKILNGQKTLDDYRAMLKRRYDAGLGLIKALEKELLHFEKDEK